MESRKIRASSVGQLTKHVSVGPNGSTGNDYALDSNHDLIFDMTLPPGAIATKVEVRGAYAVASSGTSTLKVGSVSDDDGVASAINLKTAGGTSTPGYASADTSGDNADKFRFTIASSNTVSSGPIRIWLEYRFDPDIVWSQDAL